MISFACSSDLYCTHGEEAQDSENAAGSGDSGPEAERRASGLEEGGESEAAISAPPPPAEEVDRTSSDRRSDGCTAKHTRSGRTEDA